MYQGWFGNRSLRNVYLIRWFMIALWWLPAGFPAERKKTQLLAFVHGPIPSISESDSVLPRSFPIVCLQAVRIRSLDFPSRLTQKLKTLINISWHTYHIPWRTYHILSYTWVNYNISLTWIKAILGWFPLLTMIPVRSQWDRYNLPIRNICKCL